MTALNHTESPFLGKTILVTGSSRGIGAETARLFSQAGAKLAINYRDKFVRAEKLATELRNSGGEVLSVKADLTDNEAVSDMFRILKENFGHLDVLVLNASGGMESDMPEDYALRLNRDAQLDVLHQALPHMPVGSRIVFITSHQAHFIHTTQTMELYDVVARSKKAGELALLSLVPMLEEKGIGFVIVSGDMISGTITATLLERANPGTLSAREKAAGKLYNVADFAQEIVNASCADIPDDHIVFVGDTSDFR